MLQTLYDCFWYHRLWLPANLTWADLEDQDNRVYAKASNLYITIPLAFVFLVVRYFVENYAASPHARVLGMEDKVWLRAAFNPVLEKFYTQSSKHLKQTDLENLSQASNFTVCQVERWFRRRRDQERPSLQKKFREASWRFTFYLLAFIAGMAVLVDHELITREWHQVQCTFLRNLDDTKLYSSVQRCLTTADTLPLGRNIPDKLVPTLAMEIGGSWGAGVCVSVMRVDNQICRGQVLERVAVVILTKFSFCATLFQFTLLLLILQERHLHLPETDLVSEESVVMRVLRYADVKTWHRITSVSMLWVLIMTGFIYRTGKNKIYLRWLLAAICSFIPLTLGDCFYSGGITITTLPAPGSRGFNFGGSPPRKAVVEPGLIRLGSVVNGVCCCLSCGQSCLQVDADAVLGFIHIVTILAPRRRMRGARRARRVS
ncbi:ceramide synthase 2 [Pelobates cultripes]|uniref:Ceramide synthase 2 n=1 Tax=Pelobates cultripes TaxID=61616 RepID=A0AAD1TGY1_PELCU|nr:ceramide synthase 2 [Pelobates cultripes]